MADLAIVPKMVERRWKSSRYPTLDGRIFDYRGVPHGRSPFFAGVWSLRTGGTAKRYVWVDSLAEAVRWLEDHERMTERDE